MSLDIIARGMAASADTKAQLAVNMIADFPTGLHWKGSCAWDELPSNPEQGDAWTIIDKNNAEYAWNGSEWQRIDTYNVDQSYDSTSANAQSGKAVAEALDSTPKNIVDSRGNSSLAQVNHLDEGVSPVALGKWSMAEGRMDYVEGSISAVNSTNVQISASAIGNYNIRNVRINAILWVHEDGNDTNGAYFYVVDTDRGTPTSTITLDAVTRQTRLESGGTVQRTFNITAGMKFRAYMGAAAASCSHTEGNFNNTVWLESDKEINESNVHRSHAEGSRVLVTGYSAHGEGVDTLVTGDQAHGEGNGTKATGAQAHSEGYHTRATGDYSHSEGISTKATGSATHSTGVGTSAGYEAQTVVGRYNDNKSNSVA